MTTRAIAAYKENDKYIGAWIWCDGYPHGVGRKLRNKIKTLEEAKELISIGMMESLFGKREAKEFQNYPSYTKDDAYIPCNGLVAHQLEQHKGVKPKKYASIEDMLGQDINYVYVFNAENQKWKTYK